MTFRVEFRLRNNGRNPERTVVRSYKTREAAEGAYYGTFELNNPTVFSKRLIAENGEEILAFTHPSAWKRATPGGSR